MVANFCSVSSIILCNIDGMMVEIIDKSDKYNNEEKFILISSEEITKDYSQRYAKMNDLVEKQFKVRIFILYC